MPNAARILLPFNEGLIEVPEAGEVLFIRPSDSLPSDFAMFPQLVCEQGFKPFADRLTSGNLTVTASATGEFPMILMALTRSRAENMANFARACRVVAAGGTVLVSGSKTDGIDSMLKAVKKLMPVDGVMSKSHGKVFWTTVNSPALPEWESAAAPKTNPFGFVTAPGMFSPEKIDRGSALLATYFDKSVKGSVADLGAGWGFLAQKALAQCETITTLDLYEAEHSALEAAKQNVTDERAAFHWADVSDLQKPAEGYQTVIANPPFHQGRAAEPAIGISFIATAARILRPSGQLLLVANRQLPYETALDLHFKHWEFLHQDKGFKIIRARRPLNR